MGFNVYAGGMARYYSRRWETPAQKWAREQGVRHQLIGLTGEPPEALEWDEAVDCVECWREGINQALEGHIPQPLAWDEAEGAPYTVQPLDYDSYGALQVWASHTIRETTPPETYDQPWHQDEAYIECSDPMKAYDFWPFICGNLWLPGDFTFAIPAPDLTDTQVCIGSNRTLVQALMIAKQCLFDGEVDDLEPVLNYVKPSDPSLESSAKLALSVLLRVSLWSAKHRLPMLLND